MTSHYTYMWQRPTLPEKGISWKKTSQMLQSAVPTWSRPIENGEKNMNKSAFGSARPLKHWRKQLNPRKGSGQGRSGVGMPMDTPGGKISLAMDVEENKQILKGDDNNQNCHCENAKRANDYIMPDNRYKNETKNSKKLATFKFLNPETNYTSVSCVACSPQANVTKPATTILSKKYYTDSRAYLRARNKRYTQNLSGTEVSNIKYKDAVTDALLWPSDEQDGVRWRGSQIRSGSNCLSSCCPENPGEKIVTRNHTITQNESNSIPEEVLGQYADYNDIAQFKTTQAWVVLQKIVYVYSFGFDKFIDEFDNGIPNPSVWPISAAHQTELDKLEIVDLYVNEENPDVFMMKVNLDPTLASYFGGPIGCVGVITSNSTVIQEVDPFGRLDSGVVLEGGEIINDFYNIVVPVDCNIDLENYVWGSIRFLLDPTWLDNLPYEHTNHGNAVGIVETIFEVPDKVRCPAKLIYKPSNREFSVQGAVDSSSRIERLKLKTITKSANSMGGRNGKGPFGMEGVNASRYTGRSEAPYFLKSKNQICKPCQVFQNHTVCFYTPTGNIGDKFPTIPDIDDLSSLEKRQDLDDDLLFMVSSRSSYISFEKDKNFFTDILERDNPPK